ncbi:MAG: TonB-dependent receptor [Bacteroidota bacterium]
MRIIFMLLLTLHLLDVIAQKEYLIDTVYVTATQIPLKINETGRNITVVTAKQIASMPATSLDEVLQTVPGLEVQSRGGFGAQGDILLRGSTFTQVLILIDGMKLNDPLTGHFNSYIPVTPAEIDRIEILRGAAAAMYGADAVGGVINIVTKTFSNTNQEGMNLSGALNYGDHKLVSGHQGFSIKKGKVTFGGGFSMNQSEGEFIPERMIDTATTLESYNNFFDIKTVGASFGYQFENGIAIRARTSYDFRDFGARYFYTTNIFDKATETVANWWNHLQVSRTTQSSATDFNVAYKYNTDEFVFSPDFPSTNNHVTQLLNFTLNHMEVLHESFTLKVGAQLDQRKIESNDRGNHEDLHFGAYAMGVYRQNNLNLTASLRADYDENYEFEFSPQLNLSYVLPKIVFRASVGRSIRAADYTERYVSNNLENLLSGRSLGNPDLLAERGWSQEVGLDYSITDTWQVKLTGFARFSNNLIDFVLTNENEIGSVSEVGSLRDDADYFFAKNVEEVSTLGVEVESHLNQPIGDYANLQWSLGYTFINTALRDAEDNDIVTVYISSHARHLVTSQLVLNWDKFDIALNGLYKERNEQIATTINRALARSYSVWNARFGFRLTEAFGLNFQIQNLFDKEYQNILGAEMPGRWLMGGVRWSL